MAAAYGISSELKNRNTKDSCVNLLNYNGFSSYHSVFPELSPNELQTAAMYPSFRTYFKNKFDGIARREHQRWSCEQN